MLRPPDRPGSTEHEHSLTYSLRSIQCGDWEVASEDAGITSGGDAGWTGQGTEAPEGGAHIVRFLATEEQGMITPRRGRGQSSAGALPLWGSEWRGESA